jgi:hypothetical protein
MLNVIRLNVVARFGKTGKFQKGQSLFEFFFQVFVGKEKSFNNTDTSGLYYKSFMIVIYDSNDSTIVELLL